MIALTIAAACYALFLPLEAFALALDRISPIRLRGLVEDDPRRFGPLAGREGAVAVRMALRILLQILLLVGLIFLIRAAAMYTLHSAWAWGGGVFVAGWILSEALLLRLVSRLTPETALARLAPGLAILAWPLSPLLAVIGWTLRSAGGNGPVASDEDVQAYIDVGREEGILEKDEERMLASIVDFGETTVKEVMTPRTDLVAVAEDTPLARLADLFLDSHYSRIPVYRGTVDQIVGIVHVKDAFDAVVRHSASAIGAISRPATFVPEMKRTSELLRDFQRRHLAMAVVVDEYGGVSGLVTIEDLLEEIVGEISDEHEDERDAVVTLPGGGYSVAGRTHVEVLQELFGHGPAREEFDSLGGYLSARLGRIPKAGDRVEEDGLRLVVEEADRRRVLRVRVESAGPAASEGEA